MGVDQADASHGSPHQPGRSLSDHGLPLAQRAFHDNDPATTAEGSDLAALYIQIRAKGLDDRLPARHMKIESDRACMDDPETLGLSSLVEDALACRERHLTGK